MSEKRTNKSKEELTKELQDKKANDFRERLKMLEDEFGFRLEPVLHFSHKGIVPTINVVDAPEPVVPEKVEEEAKE